MIKRILIIGYILSCHCMVSAQLTYGVTGLLHTPSAEMQKDKTVMIGGNFMNKEITPPIWSYHTYNYFLNVTIFPWLEVAYTCTLFKSQTIGIDWKTGKGKFTNQDRYFSVRMRMLKEGQFLKYMPAVVVGASDPFTESGDGQIASTQGNGYFSRFFVAATKHIPVGKEKIGIHLSYLYNNRKDYSLNGMAGGISYMPSILSDLTVIAEYDSKNIAFGATYLLFNHLHAQVEMQKMKYFTGGLTYKIYLK
ncbi:YjbH domain-containing protein [uncultured Bacteroides sp.]|uniref:YjbH domain-containing protein n=1 Tax=uncultured Bacteroides sp. TaxID=162156 RepID=UPI002AA7D6FD|nr:YjbH domain-containing protein [uncultured Bacteroides sp.]